MSSRPTAPVAYVIRQVVAGLADPANSYFLNAIYYEYEGQKQFTADIYLQGEDVRHAVSTDDALEVEVHLSPHRPDWYPIRIPYAVIWKVQQSRTGGMMFTAADRELFISMSVFDQLIPLWRQEVAKSQAPQPDA